MEKRHCLYLSSLIKIYYYYYYYYSVLQKRKEANSDCCFLSHFVAGGISFSGVNDYDYPFLSSPSVGLAGMELVSLLKRVPLPAELVEQFDRILVVS